MLSKPRAVEAPVAYIAVLRVPLDANHALFALVAVEHRLCVSAHITNQQALVTKVAAKLLPTFLALLTYGLLCLAIAAFY